MPPSKMQQTKTKSPHHRLCPCLGIELAEQGVDVELRGVLADPKGAADIFVREAFSEKLQHLPLTGCQRFDKRGVGGLLGRSRLDDLVRKRALAAFAQAGTQDSYKSFRRRWSPK